MYRVCIPINNKKYNEKEKALLLRELKRAEADTVFVIFWRVLRNREAQTEMLQLFSENIAFLQQNGFKTGAWIAPTIGYGRRFCKHFAL